MLLLRQLAATGLTMLLLPLWRRRHPLALARGCGGACTEAAGSAAAGTQQQPELSGEGEPRQVDPAAVSAAAAALRDAVLADPPAFVQALLKQLAHGHPLLGAEGQQRSVRCAGAGHGGRGGGGQSALLRLAKGCGRREWTEALPGPRMPLPSTAPWGCAPPPPPPPSARRQLLGMSRDDMMIKMVTKTLTR